MFAAKNNMKKKNTASIVTAHNLGKIILEKKIVPTPIYTSGRENSCIKRGKSPKF